jgi:hypothetical protein
LSRDKHTEWNLASRRRSSYRRLTRQIRSVMENGSEWRSFRE